MHDSFVEQLKVDARPFVPLSGNRTERLAAAATEVRRLLAGGH